MKMNLQDLSFIFLLVSESRGHINNALLLKMFAQPEICNIYTTVVRFFFSGLVFPVRTRVG